MKKKLLLLFILIMTLISFKARAATYNFNFYNNEKEEVASPLSSAPQAAPIPAPTTPLISPLSQSTTEASQSIEGVKEWLFSLGANYYTKGSSKTSQSPFTISRFKFEVKKSDGMNLSLSLGRPGGIKIIADIIKENQELLFFTMNAQVKRRVKAYGAGLNLRKEFLYKSVLGFEMGVGAQYLAGEYKGENSNGMSYTNFKREEIKTKTISGLAQAGFNFHFDKVTLALQGFYSQNSMNIASNFNTVDKTLKYNTTGASLGLAYSF